MSFRDPPGTAMSRDDFPSAISEVGAPSILSSQMTDISEDGGREEVNAAGRRPSGAGLPWGKGHHATQSASSRPGTGNAGGRGAWARSPPSRSAGQRMSILGGSGNKVDTTPGRPPTTSSSASRTHVPSLTSHAFFRPMSSQRLQAQRGGQRPLSTSLGQDSNYRGDNRQSMNSNPTSLSRSAVGEEVEAPPPSRGTEMTDPETVEGNTFRSMSDSARPLQRIQAATRNLSLNLSENHSRTTSAGQDAAKSPRNSFRSSFLSPSRDTTTPKRGDSHGREKLSSVSSTPGTARAAPPSDTTLKNKPGHNYQYFTGNTVFCWGGRLQNTRHRPINIATGLFVIIPGILFFVFSASWTWYNMSPAVPIIFGYLYYICVSSFIHASLSDPGILPRNLHPMPPPSEMDDPLMLAPPTTEWTVIKSFPNANTAMEIPTKFCRTCNLWRPPRAHHCRICDNCIETQDHHCVWLNNCVGRRNYRYFFTFVSSSTLLGAYLFAVSLAQVLVYSNINNTTVGDAIDHFRVPFAMFVYGILATPYPAALTGYHLFLMARGETTREYLNSHKFSKGERHRPFTQGSIVRNLVAVLCRPRPPTYLNFKKSYEEGDQRFGERRGKRTAPLVSQEGVEMHGVKRGQEQQQPPQPQHGFQVRGSCCRGSVMR